MTARDQLNPMEAGIGERKLPNYAVKTTIAKQFKGKDLSAEQVAKKKKKPIVKKPPLSSCARGCMS